MKIQLKLLTFVLSTLLFGIASQSYAQGRMNNHEAIWLSYFTTSTGFTFSVCSYRPAQNIDAMQKNGKVGKAYQEPQGDEGIQVAFSPFFAFDDECEDFYAFLSDLPDGDPLPHEQ